MDIRIARRYAQAIFQAAKSQNSVLEAEQDLVAVSSIIESREDLRAFLESPETPRSQKLEMVDKLFADRARPITLRLLRMMIEKRRETAIPAVREEYIRLREESAGILRITITSAMALTEQEVGGIVSRIASQTKKTVLPQTKVDSKLLGGVAVQYGNSVLDGSVEGALRRLKDRLFIDLLKQA